ncbi:MAG: bifunctional lysylphosphatidylglycerol flippase/synthetase MprF [Burkholderiaceae bacterium]|nr:bifunctional lysylphosphatidylglycerol flippase/synthetase MprF [Burkholderiaceae bacterium]
MSATSAPDPSTPVKPRPALPWRWLERFSAYKHWTGPLLVLVLFGLGLIGCRYLLQDIDPSALHQAIADIPGHALLGAVLATAVGFVALIGYEWSACRYAGADLRWRSIVTGGFCAFAIGNAVGLSLLSGGSVRYRLYARHGIGAGTVARITVFTSLSLALSLPLVFALTTLVNPDLAAQALRLPTAPLLGGSIALLAGAALLTFVLARRPTLETPTPHSRIVGFGRHTLRLPGWRLGLGQLLVTALDVLAAGTVLYLLLPNAPPFGVFLLVYLIALAAGVISHVPGGAGVFEGVFLLAFAGTIEPAPLAAALLLYRVIYLLLPLLLACVVLLVIEGRRLARAREALRMASGLAAPVLAVLVFLSGVVLLFSGATPEIDSRLHAIGILLPHRLIDASHLGASLVGVLCLLLAQGLHRRLSAAWVLTLVLLLVGIALSLFKGFDWEEASILAVTAALLATFRRAFYRRSRLLDVPFSPHYAAAAVCVLAASVWLLLFTYQDVPYERQLWWQFALSAEAPRSLRALLISTLLLAGFGLAWLLRAAPPVLLKPSRDELTRAHDIVRASNQPDGGLVMSGDKALLFHESGESFLMYARRGRSMVALFDPIGPMRQRAELIWQFRDLCDLHHVRPVFYQVRADNLPFYMDIGLTALKLGEEARVDLSAFDLEHKDKRDLRYTLNRGQRDGLSITYYSPGEASLADLKTISDGWMRSKNVREKGFSLGRFDPDYLNAFRIAVVHYNERAVAFVNLLETDRKGVASIDLMRVVKDAPKLTMEFLMLGLILHFKAAGHTHFSLGMVPLSGLHPRRGAPLTQRLGAVLFRRGEQFYNFQGLQRFKDKFHPEWEPRYLAVPAGIDPLVALADTAALIAGGLTGLVKR